MSVAEQLADVLETVTAGDLPPSALDAAKSRLLHAVGVGIASSRLPAPTAAWAAVASSKGECVALGRAASLVGTDAAFYNGVAAHSSLQEDCGPGGLREGSHPGTYVVPAALAAAEEVGADGGRLLLGVVAGYEAVSRLGAAAPAEIVARRFRPVPLVGPIGAAAAAAVVHGFPPSITASAIALAANMSGGVSQGFLEGTMEPYFHAGFAARSGLLAARLAEAGAVTANSTFEGELGFFETFGGAKGDLAQLTSERPELAVCRVGTKRFPSCVQNQATMALIVEHLPDGVEPESIERVTLRRPPHGTNGFNSPGVDRSPPFHNMLQTQMSARFTAAAALLRRPVEQPTWFRDAYLDDGVTALAEKIDLVASDDDTVALEIVLREGDTVTLDADTSQVLFPDGAEIRRRFVARCEPLLGGAAEEAAALVDRLNTIEDVKQLTAKLRPSQGD